MSRITVRRVPGENIFELAYPSCVRARKEDMEEVRAVLDAGEIDVAVDELRWLLEGCRELLEAHQLLGEIALTDNDLILARGHLGYAYEMGLGSIPEDLPGPLAYARPANRPLFEAGKGLAWSLKQLGETKAAARVVERLLRLDPSDPLGLKSLNL
ncbi:MAG: hypothetical protein ACLQNE_39180 [Thermoguttaceae bacterium]